MIASWRSYTLGVVSASAVFILILTLTAGPKASAGGHDKANSEESIPVYMITVGRMLPEGDLGPYTLKMLEAAQGRGMESLAFSSSFKVFEGTWEHDGFLSVERAPSMKAVEDFWSSETYQQAIALREGVLEIDYAVAVEGR